MSYENCRGCGRAVFSSDSIDGVCSLTNESAMSCTELFTIWLRENKPDTLAEFETLRSGVRFITADAASESLRAWWAGAEWSVTIDEWLAATR